MIVEKQSEKERTGLIISRPVLFKLCPRTAICRHLCCWISVGFYYTDTIENPLKSGKTAVI